MLVRDLMTSDPFTITPSATLDEAMELMDRLEVRHAPVVEEGRLVGVISERDLLEHTGWIRTEGPPASARKVSEVMTAKPHVVDPDTEIVSTVVEIITGAVGCLPVIQDGRLVGIVSETDILCAMQRALRGEHASSPPDPPVRDLMTERVITAGPGTSQSEAKDLCRRHRVRHLPLIEGERFVGIISDRDLRRAHGRHQEHEPLMDIAMRRAPLTVSPDVPVSKAVGVVIEGRVSSLPVVDENGSLVGIVTSTDLVDHAMNVLFAME